MLKIHAVPAFTDNYIWLIQAESTVNVIVVDPGDESPVLDWLKRKQLTPVAILITHHHPDHIGGVKPLVQRFDIPVYGPINESIPAITHSLTRQSQLSIHPDFPTAEALSIPGHTGGHIAYLFENQLFCGDTLFAAGCGRLLGGTAEQLFNSLQQISQLASDTAIYCAHEYTEANLKFAQTVEPSNSTIKHRIKETALIRREGKATIPTTLAKELLTNPFLRCDEKEVIQSASEYAGRPLTNPLEVFTALRSWKDRF